MPKRGVVNFVAVLAAGFALGVVGIAAWYIFGQSEPAPWIKPAAIDGATVRLTYEGSKCRDSVDVDVDEDSTRVIITVRETVRARGLLLADLDPGSATALALATFIRSSTDALWKSSFRDDFLLAGDDWTKVPSGKIAYASQLSAIMALEQRARLESG